MWPSPYHPSLWGDSDKEGLIQKGLDADNLTKLCRVGLCQAPWDDLKGRTKIKCDGQARPSGVFVKVVVHFLRQSL